MHSRLQKAIRALKRDYPLRRPVRVRTVKTLACPNGHRLFATADLVNDVFLITIQRHKDISIQIDSAWHEWTHCLLWPRCKYRHSKAFWDRYGQIYRHYQDEK